ncbi:hypothetical protein B0A49_08441 [Cryomyces minteri]|uniref:RNase H type-1 domain-containing protein n=1 Tax=Cryomyces minteri TaxID=331657 RepID=A0A4U0XCF2_9PEZI|nr:hypothetical protein B0A49_08441 [Cryomyces minteri]
MKRRRETDLEIHAQLSRVRNEYFAEIRRQKKAHWREFLDAPANVWKANVYTRHEPGLRRVPPLQKDGVTATTDKEKADMLMHAFFPAQPIPAVQESENEEVRPIRSVSLTRHEVQEAIFAANPKKAPGRDGLPFRVWRELWPVLGDPIFHLYETSLRLGHVPQRWKTAKIVTIWKPGKPDYTIPKAYRPISLLPTISKGLDAVVANRISYLAEKYSLLPKNHFGARRQRSCEQALSVLIERIHAAWRAGKVLSLVSFDVQGACNGVNKDVLCERLRKRRIPEELVRWVDSFRSNRMGCVALGSFCSQVATIEYPGLPQGSPLSPILYILYNADLVKRPIDSNGGALGFVDDFTAWVTGPSTGPNTRKIQDTILPVVERWAEGSGVTFEVDKTAFIHFTRNPGKEDSSAESIAFRGQSVSAGPSIKLLGVVLDKQLDMKLHMARLYIATVTPIMDYAASIWYAPGRRGLGRHIKILAKVQRLGAQAITRAFRTVAHQILEVEANLYPTEFRLRTKSARHLVKCYTLPNEHPVRQCLDLASEQGASFPSPMAQNIRAYEDALQPSEQGRVEVIQPWTVAPYSQRLGQCVSIESSKKRAKQLALDLPWRDTLYTDGSYWNNSWGAAVIKIKGNRVPITIRSKTVGTASSTSILATELHAIVLALEHIQALPRWEKERRQFPVATDSREALRAIQTPYAKSGQYLVQRAAAAIKDIRKNKSQVQLTWIPAHSGIAGNEAADSAALKTTEQQAPIDTTSTRLWTQVYRLALTKIRQDRLESFQQENVYGKYARRLDGALLGRHTLRLYSFLRTYLARIGREQSGRFSEGVLYEIIALFLDRMFVGL